MQNELTFPALIAKAKNLGLNYTGQSREELTAEIEAAEQNQTVSSPATSEENPQQSAALAKAKALQNFRKATTDIAMGLKGAGEAVTVEAVTTAAEFAEVISAAQEAGVTEPETTKAVEDIVAITAGGKKKAVAAKPPKAAKEPKAPKPPKEPKAPKAPKEPKEGGRAGGFARTVFVEVSPEMQSVLDEITGGGSKSEAFRKLATLGMPTKQIAEITKSHYSFVYNTIAASKKAAAEGAALSPAPSTTAGPVE